MASGDFHYRQRSAAELQLTTRRTSAWEAPDRLQANPRTSEFLQLFQLVGTLRVSPKPTSYRCLCSQRGRMFTTIQVNVEYSLQFTPPFLMFPACRLKPCYSETTSPAGVSRSNDPKFHCLKDHWKKRCIGPPDSEKVGQTSETGYS